jgi:hypothetical protein
MSECVEAGAGEHGPDQSRVELRHQSHRLQGRTPEVGDGVRCRSSANSRRRANSAASISVLRGRIDASTTPNRAAACAWRRKSSMPCSKNHPRGFFGHA